MAAKIALRGLNWAHRRATAPMIAATRAFQEIAPEIDIEWDVQSLAGFEHALGGGVTKRYDLVVFDHPYCGSIRASGLFRPADEFLPDLRDGDFVGASLASYRYGGSIWGVPVDGATQTAVYRADLLAEFGPPPSTWDQVVDLGRRLRFRGKWLGLACLNPHGFLVLAALCANLGAPFAADPLADPIDRRVLDEATGQLLRILPYVHPSSWAQNAIQLHEAMQAGDEIVFCPAAYAYLTHAERDFAKPLAFGAFPGPSAPHHRGSVLGGTGLGVTAGCRAPEAAARFVSFVAAAPVQMEIFAANHGQPGRVEAWRDARSNALFGNAFQETVSTVEAAWVRPRFTGYIGIQHRLGAIFGREFLDLPGQARMDAIRKTWASALASPAGDITPDATTA
ncbi:MAG: extracellular solute-binding protein [Tagaea sp.]|nr:extracellular solute-binding protein [Tagaea sp.]